MNNKFKIGQKFIAGNKVPFCITLIEDDLITITLTPNNKTEWFTVEQAEDYIEEGWWKLAVSPNQIWKELNEA
jgi:hypothetical protein